MYTRTIQNAWTLVAFAMLAVITPSRTRADTYWVNPGSGNAYDGTNWSSGLPLGSGQGTAFFTNNSSYQVTYGGAYVPVDQVSYNATGGTVTNLLPGGGNYINALGGFFVGDAAGSTASVVQVSGAMYSLGGLVIGNNGQGHLTLSGSTGITAGNNVLIGNNSGSAGSTFVITNGASMGSSSFTEIGVNSGADNNAVLLTGPGTTWSDGYHNYLGVYGAGNTMRIENGASFVKGGYVQVIGYYAGSSNNTMTVTGTNTTWTVNDAGGFGFYIGNGGANNSFIVSNGATAKINGAATVVVGYGSSVGDSGTGNSLLISGPNSTLTMTNAAANLTVGLERGNNRLVIENGGRLVMGGNFSEGSTDDYNLNASNTVLVTGANSYLGIGGSTMNLGTAYSLPVGSRGNNSFTISNGAAVKFDGSAVSLGYWYAGGSSFTVTGPGSVFSNTAANFGVGYYWSGNRVQVDNGGQFYGSNMTVAAGNTLTITNGGVMSLSDKLILPDSALKLVGGSLQTRNSTASGTTVVGGGPDTATWTMLGGSNTLATLEMGNNGVLVVTNGAQLQTLQFYAGYNGYTSEAGSNNLTIVTGPGTVWSNGTGNAFVVGYKGVGSTLRVEDGARVVSPGAGATYYFMGGYNTGTSNNTLMVTGSNSLFSIGGVGASIRMSDVSGGNSIIVSNGGRFQFDGSVLYMGIGAGNDSMAISSPNSAVVMSNANLYAAWAGANNRLTIDNGGALVASNVYIGYQGANATATVTGPNSLLNGLDTIAVGSFGSASLVVSNAAVAQAKTITVGTAGSKITVSGGSLLATNATTTGQLTVNTGSLTITNGGAVVADQLTANGPSLVVEGGSLQTRGSTITGIAAVGGGPETGTWTMLGGINSLATLETGHNGVMIVTNGARLQTLQYYSGYDNNTSSAGSNGLTIVTGAGTIWSNGTANAFVVGYAGAGNTLRIEDGARVFALGSSSTTYIGDNNASASNNSIIVTGSNSLLQTSGDFRVGNYGAYSTLVISNGAKVQHDGTLAYLGLVGSANNSAIIVSGPGSSLYMTNTTGAATFGYNAPNNRLVIENGGQMFSYAASGSSRMMVGQNSALSTNNTITVTGSNSLWRIYVDPANALSEFTFGNASSGNTMVISNRGQVQYDGKYFEIGNGTANNSVTVTGAGSVYSNANANYYVGYNGANNRLYINNGGQFYGSNVIVSQSGYVNNGIEVRSGGLLDANLISVFNGNYITNFGGIYQFSTATPTLVTGTAMVLTNGTVSFRNVANAPVGPVSGITYLGVNSYQLSSASNATMASYTFDAGLGASNYQKLQMTGDHPAWQSTSLTIGSSGALVVSNATGAAVAASVTDAGAISVFDSTVTWSGPVAISGSYVSDPSTNTFMSNVVVAASGTLAGGAGDLFDFKKSLIINSTNNLGFQLATSAVEFSGGGMHTNAITGADLGTNYNALVAAFVTQTNFAYGELHLGSAADQVCFSCGNIPSIASNALYVGWLDLFGNASLVTNLHAASGINIYYNMEDLRNAYLGQQSFQLTDCNFAPGGGFLMPAVPEPSALALLGIGAMLWLRRRQ